MLKKLLHLYNDGHNPFPKIKGDGLHLIGGEYEYDDNPADHNVYDSGFITGNYEPEGDNKFKITDEYGNIIDVDRKAPIEAPDYYEKLTSQVDYALEDDNDRFDNDEYYDDDDVLEDINERIEGIRNEIGQTTKGSSTETYVNKLKLLEEEEKAEKKNIIKIRLQQQQISNSFMELAVEADNAYDRSMITLTDKQKQRFYDMFEDVVQKMNVLFKPNNDINDPELILIEANKIVRVTKQPIQIILKILYKDAMDSLEMSFVKSDKDLFPFFKRYAYALSKIAFSDEVKAISELKRKEFASNERLNEINQDKIFLNSKNEEIKTLQKQYAERKKVLDHKKRLSEIKELYKTDPEQAAKDALELNAELKKAAAEKQSLQLSKSAQKKANAAAKKAAAEKQAEKQAEAPVVNAQAALKSTGTYGKKLETFFTGGGQPILQKFTGDKSKIHDIEKQEIIPDEDVTFDDKTTNSLRKACTLDLYNDKFVFEIKNYVNNSITDDVIPMQPSKFAGTKYFIPTYLEDGRLYSLNLDYISPITGIHHTQNILPPSANGREVVFVIRLKEGLFQYKPFLDKENNKLIHNGEFASGKRLLYFFDYTNLKPCLDYKKKAAFNIKDHLTPI